MTNSILTDKVSFGQRTKGGDGGRPVWTRNILGRGSSKNEVLEVMTVCFRNSR